MAQFLVRIPAFLTVLALTLGGSGCGSAPLIRPMAARPVVVAGAEGAPDAAGFLLDIELENAGTRDIPLERFDYVFAVEGVGRFEGRWAAFLTLPPGTTRRVTIPASMPLPADLATEVDLRSNIPWTIDGGLRYQAPGLFGRILFDAGIRRPSASFSGSGTFRLQQPPQSDAPGTGSSTEESAESA